MESAVDAVNAAYASDPKLRKRIFDAINETPRHGPLFEDIAKYQLSTRQLTVTNGTQNDVDGHSSKKRKLETGEAAKPDQTSQPREVILEARDISFSMPQRKKFHLNIVQYGKEFAGANTSFAICARNPATNQIEFEYPMSTFTYAVRALVPEKAQKQYNYCLMPSTQTSSTDGSLAQGEGLIWTVNHGPLKSCNVMSSALQELVTGSEDVLGKALDAVLQKTNNKLIVPTEAEFSCAHPESHRKNEKAYHVKAHRGSKDGYLFFLSTGIFFGFKKPLAFFSFHEIESVSYTAVLQRTFNLVITVMTSQSDAEPQEIEFSMLDQADFGGIDAYIKKHQLQDASMAETRRAKQFKVNGKQAAEADGEPGELEKAEAEMVDEEDELEEDYDPGEEGDSDGSGSSDEDEDEYAEDEAGGNIVEEELGSEAEEVEEEEEEDGRPRRDVMPDPDDDDQL